VRELAGQPLAVEDDLFRLVGGQFVFLFVEQRFDQVDRAGQVTGVVTRLGRPRVDDERVLVAESEKIACDGVDATRKAREVAGEFRKWRD
jgi:hypothetical protein